MRNDGCFPPCLFHTATNYPQNAKYFVHCASEWVLPKWEVRLPLPRKAQQSQLPFIFAQNPNLSSLPPKWDKVKARKNIPWGGNEKILNVAAHRGQAYKEQSEGSKCSRQGRWAWIGARQADYHTGASALGACVLMSGFEWRQPSIHMALFKHSH